MIREHLVMSGRKAVAPSGGLGADVVDGQVARGHLLLEPFTGVPFGGPDPVGELHRRRRAVGRERPVVAETIADVDGINVEGSSTAPKILPARASAAASPITSCPFLPVVVRPPVVRTSLAG